jgi:hypothetical protein
VPLGKPKHTYEVILISDVRENDDAVGIGLIWLRMRISGGIF